MERHYDADAVAALSKKEYAYTSQDGVKHEYTRYEAEQTQRKIEHTIRKYKKRVAVFESAGLQNPEAKARLGEWQAVARDFVKQTGLRRDYAREYIGVERTLWNQGQAQPRGSSPIESIKLAKTTEEAQNIALKLGVNADYGNMNVNVANMVNKEIESAKKIFGLDNFEGVKVGTSKENSYAEYNRITKTVSLANVSDENSLERMKQDAKKQFDCGFWSTNKKEHSVRHEIGHHIFHEYTDNNPVLRDKIEKIYLEKKQEVLQNNKWNLFDEEGQRNAKLRGVSYYALSRLGDFGAECIAEYLSGNPRATAKLVCELLREAKK